MTLVLSESKTLRIGSMMIFYIAQGLPIGLFLTGITSWISENGQSAGAVAAVVATTYMPWSFKFIIGPFMDRYTYLPMGRRRIWLIVSQAVMLAGLALAAFVGPGPSDLGLIAWVGFAIFCGSAAQDVAVDGLAVDILPDEEQGTASAFMFGGQSVGIASGAAAGGLSARPLWLGDDVHGVHAAQCLLPAARHRAARAAGREAAALDRGPGPPPSRRSGTARAGRRSSHSLPSR